METLTYTKSPFDINALEATPGRGILCSIYTWRDEYLWVVAVAGGGTRHGYCKKSDSIEQVDAKVVAALSDLMSRRHAAPAAL